MRFARLFVGLLLACTSLLRPAVASAVTFDLNGTWVEAKGGVINVVQDGDEVKARAPGGWAEAEEPANFVTFYGTFDNNKLSGKALVMLLDKAPSNEVRKARCGEHWKEYVDLELTLSSDGKRLEGRWLNHANDYQTCAPAPAKEFWEAISFTREGESPRPKPNLLLMGGVLALLAVVCFAIRNAYVNYLVGSLKRSPDSAGLAGWLLFGSLLFASALICVALAGGTPVVLAPLGVLSALSLVGCILLSRRT